MGMIAGLLGCVFGVLGIVSLEIIFVPLAALCAVIGLIGSMGGRSAVGIGTSLLAGVLSAIGFAVSPRLWALVGGLLVDSQVHEVTGPATTAPPAMVKWYQRVANQGSAKAQFNLGLMYDAGQGVPQNYAEAVKWYRMAADQGDAAAQSKLGFIYANGQGVPQNYAEAVKWYQMAADQGDVAAQSNLGLMYANGQGVPQNYTEAVKWYQMAADQGDAAAQSNLGFIYANGQGVPQNYAAAVNWYRMAAAQGNRNAQSDLAAVYARFPALREQQDIATTAVPTAPAQPPTDQSDRSAKAIIPGFAFAEAAKKISNVPDLFQLAVDAVQDAGRVYCARSTPAACSSYKSAAAPCPDYILEVQGIFLTLRVFEHDGMTPGQAATQVYRDEVSQTPMRHDVLSSAIRGAAQVPQGQEAHFAWNVFSACLRAAEQ